MKRMIILFLLLAGVGFGADPVARWKLNEQSGTSIADSAGSNTGAWVGTELLTNGDFADWTGVDPDGEPDNWSVLGTDSTNDHKLVDATSACQLISTDGAIVQISQVILTIGKTYTYSINVTSLTGSLRIGPDSDSAIVITSTGVKTGTFIADNTDFIIKRNSIVDATFTDVSVREQVSSVPAPSSTGLLFDGVGDYVILPDSALWDDTTQTHSAWVKLDSGWSASGYVISRRSTLADNWAFFVNTGRTIKVSGDDSGVFVETVDTISVNEWTLLTVVFNGTNAEIYINGISSISGLITNIGTSSSMKPLIGARWDAEDVSSLVFFEGAIDDVRIYNTALSAIEVKQLYLAYFGGIRSRYSGGGTRSRYNRGGR
jgi:hypothetical protein